MTEMKHADGSEPSETHPLYFSMPEGKPGAKTRMWMIVCDEGWRQSIVCTGMYAWATDWLVRQVQGTPYATLERAREYARTQDPRD